MDNIETSQAPRRIRKLLSRFSLRSFLILIACVALWLGWTKHLGNHQRAVIHIVQKSGGSVHYKFKENNSNATAPIRSWVASKVGEEFVFSIAGVYLKGEKVDDGTTRSLAPHLEALRYLKWLEFRGTKITDQGVQHLDKLNSLERFFVRPIHRSGIPIRVTHIGLESIANLENLKLLSLHHGKITGEGFKSISELSEIEGLSFYETDIDDAALESLKGLTKLKEIDLCKTDISDEGLANLCCLPKLENVYLYDTKITDQGLQLLSKNVNLRILGIGNTEVTDSGLANLRGLQSLHELRLWNTSVSDAGLKHLAGLKNLRILRLGSTQITDAGIAELESWTHLEELEVTLNNISKASVARLRAALPKCRID